MKVNRTRYETVCTFLTLINYVTVENERFCNKNNGVICDDFNIQQLQFLAAMILCECVKCVYTTCRNDTINKIMAVDI